MIFKLWKIITRNPTFDLKKTFLNGSLFRSVENNQKNISQIYTNVEAPQFEQIMINLLTNTAKFYLQNTNVTVTCFDLGDKHEIKVND